MTQLALQHGLEFEDQYRRDGLIRLDAAFIRHLREADVGLHNQLLAARRDPSAVEPKTESELVVALAPHLEDFIGGLFGISAEVRALQGRHDALAPLYSVKRLFVQRRAVKGVTPDQAAAIDGDAAAAALEALLGEPLTEPRFAEYVARWSEDAAANAAALDLAASYAAWATLSPHGQAKHHAGVLFKAPHR